MSKKLWFKAKSYGWGWTPCSWEGWLVLLFACVSIFLNTYFFNEKNKEFSYLFFVRIFLTIFILIFICYKKGEKPGWRWGDKSFQ